MSVPVEIVGKRFGRIVIVEDVGMRRHRRIVRCLCDCGVTFDTRLDSLKARIDGEKSCGCYRRERTSEYLKRRLVDISGSKFGRLTVLEYSRESEHKHYWLCRCECGNEKVVRGDSLKNGSIRSCGCYLRAAAAATGRANLTTHGMSNTPMYHTWCAMKRRCYTKSSSVYAYYGGRGITVCDRWRNSFVSFAEDMGPPPDGGYTIDRIDNEGNYTPENCRWATRKEQALNRRPRTRRPTTGNTG